MSELEVLAQLDRAIEAAAVLGIDTSRAESARAAAQSTARPENLAAARAALAELGAAAGIDGPVKDLVTERRRRRAIDDSVSELALLLDMEGLERGAVVAAKVRGARLVAGPIRALATLLERRARRDAGIADPGDHLREWRRRGEIRLITDLISGAVHDSLPAIPPALRTGYTGAADPDMLDGRFVVALDRLIRSEEPETAEPPSSALARAFALLLWVDAALIVLTAAWTAVYLTGGASVPQLQIAVFGLVPAPVLFLALAAVTGLLLVLGFRRHVERLGRRWAQRLEVVVRIGARTVVQGQAFNRVDALESARLRLAHAVRRTSPEDDGTGAA